MSEHKDERGHNGLTSEETIREMTRPVPRDWKDERIAALTAENARLKAPVSEDEGNAALGEPRLPGHATFRIAASGFADLIITARASTDANTSWFCVPCGFTTRDAAEAQAHLGPHMIELTCPFDGQIWRFHTQEQADMLQKHLARHAAQKEGGQ